MEVVRIPRSGTTRIPKSLVIKDLGLATLGPGMGESAYGVLASLSCLKLNTSKYERSEFRVPPEGAPLLMN